ncbi:MAG TPA: hypothetical protein VF469_29140 [Kofleriaceae bacterium]
MSDTSDRFRELHRVLLAKDLLRPCGCKLGERPTVTQAAQLVQQGALLLPSSFAAAYANPLQERLPALFARLDAAQIDPAYLETLLGPVYQLGDAALRPELHRFLAVISNLFRSFLSSVKRDSLDIPLTEQLPPLAVWQSSPSRGPFTIPVDEAHQLINATVGVVSLPASFAGHPFLFTSLTHETGGHDVLHADPDLLPELKRGVRGLFTGANSWLGVLWDHWMDETASDIYGILNMGPGFAISLAALTGVSLHDPRTPGAGPTMRAASGRDRRGRLDAHPTDILRYSVAQGVIESLTGLSSARRKAYLDDIGQLVTLAVAGRAAITLDGAAHTDAGRAIDFDARPFPIADMQAAARKVGAYVATTRLAALGGRSIQDLETWDDEDDGAALAITAKLLDGEPVIGAGDDAQLLAGLTLALLQHPDDATYASATQLINLALDDSFARDPYWGPGAPDPRVLDAPRRARTDADDPEPMPAMRFTQGGEDHASRAAG